MPAPCYIAWNSATGALTAAPVAQATAATATVRTMLQIAPAATITAIRVIEWGYTFSTAPAAPIAMELVDTGLIFATGLTAHVAAGIHRVNIPKGDASSVQLGTALTGYNVAGAGAEGTITATREFDFHYENGLYLNKQYPLGREFEVPAGNCLRIRATPGSAAALNLACYVIWEE